MGLIGGGNQWKLSDELWEKIKLLIPKPIDNHPLCATEKEFLAER
jgi:hypothetical protein